MTVTKDGHADFFLLSVWFQHQLCYIRAGKQANLALNIFEKDLKV